MTQNHMENKISSFNENGKESIVFDCKCNMSADDFNKLCPAYKMGAGMPGLNVTASFVKALSKEIQVKFATDSSKDLATDVHIPSKLAECMNFVCRNCGYRVK